MRSNAFRFLLVAVALAMVSSAILAHHGDTNYDMKKTIVLTGSVTAFDWSNPHCLIHLDARDDAGQVRHWTLELSSTFAMSHRGWDKDTLKRDDNIVVETHPAKNGAAVGITVGPGFALKTEINGKEAPSR